MTTTDLQAAIERTWQICAGLPKPEYIRVPFWLLQMIFDEHERPHWDRAVSRAWFNWRRHGARWGGARVQPPHEVVASWLKYPRLAVGLLPPSDDAPLTPPAS